MESDHLLMGVYAIEWVFITVLIIVVFYMMVRD
jgi:hypothetical protein